MSKRRGFESAASWLVGLVGLVGLVAAGCGLAGSTQGGDGAGGGDGDGDGGSETGCLIEGVRYAVGEVVPSADGCATCRCASDGNLACIMGGCLDAGAPSCDELAALRSDALDEIQSCQLGSECGLVLSGTSCGCTRNLVARTDADTSRFVAIADAQVEGACDQGSSTCDCPAADGFACEQGRCAWNYVDTSACEYVEAARLCVRGMSGVAGESLNVGEALRVEVYPQGCRSSSCTRVDLSTCQVQGSGFALSVGAEFCLDDMSEGACTDDCGGGGFAECGHEITLELGDYRLSLGQQTVSFTVPSTVGFGGTCAGSAF